MNLDRSKGTKGALSKRAALLAIAKVAGYALTLPLPLVLTPLEYALLAFLAAAPRQVFSTGQLLAQVWGAAPGRQDGSSVAEHVYRIRRKLTAAGVVRPRIVTLRGAGYRLDP